MVVQAFSLNEIEIENRIAFKLNSIHEEIHSRFDEVETPNLSRIKEISKRINFARITSEQQILDNKGDVFYKIKINDNGKYYKNLTLDYTIQPKKVGMVYGEFSERTDKEGTKKVSFTPAIFNNYARFISDVVSQKVIYSKEIESFVMVEEYSYKVLDSVSFFLEYPVDKKQRINDFLEVMEELFREVIKGKTHDYKIYPYRLSGTNWFYDCESLKLGYEAPKQNELYFSYFSVDLDELNFDVSKDFLRMVTDDEKSLHNLSLVHAYVMLRKLDKVPAEKWFLLKDFGRSGKGLFMSTFHSIVNVTQVNFDSLSGTGFEATNEWLKFHGADLAHANETGEINVKNMRILRKIATSEVVTGRLIGQDSVSFTNRAVLILDTNESVDIGEITANKSRTVKISLKDRPRDETEQQRHEVFKPYWDFIQPNGEYSDSASLSFLINSLDYLASIGGRFIFNDVALKNYFSADDLTETQKIMISVINHQGYILQGDEELQKAIEEDYGSLRFKNAKDDIRKIGVKLGALKRVEGEVFKVNIIGDEERFKQAFTLLQAEEVT